MDTSNISLHVATKEDINTMCNLLGELFTKESDFVQDFKKQELALRLILEDEKIGHILVAKKGETTLGMVSLLYTISTALGGKVAMLEDMVVSNKEHGKGVGSKLLTYAMDFALEQDCRRITLLSDDDNIRAHAFYQRHGFSLSNRKVFVKILTCKDF